MAEKFEDMDTSGKLKRALGELAEPLMIAHTGALKHAVVAMKEATIAIDTFSQAMDAMLREDEHYTGDPDVPISLDQALGLALLVIDDVAREAEEGEDPDRPVTERSPLVEGN